MSPLVLPVIDLWGFPGPRFYRPPCVRLLRGTQRRNRKVAGCSYRCADKKPFRVPTPRLRADYITAPAGPSKALCYPFGAPP